MARSRSIGMRLLPAVVFAITLALALLQSSAHAAGAPALSGLDSARDAARQWSADAALVQITTYSAAFDGTAEGWIFVFHSPASGKSLNVNIKGAKVASTIKVAASFKTPIDGEFVDSTQAMTVARENGFAELTRAKSGKVTIMLLPAGTGTATAGLYWTLIGDWDSGKSLMIDARSGKFFQVRQTQ